MKSSLKIVWKTKIIFLLIEKLLFFFKQKYILFLGASIASAFFLPEADAKKHRYASANALLIESLKMIMWLIVRCFSISDKNGQITNVIWLSTTSFGWKLQMKSPYSKSLLVHELEFPVKNMIFHGYRTVYPTPGCRTGKMFFTNASKTIRNWFLTLQPDIF